MNQLHILECNVQGYTQLCPYIPEYKRGNFLGLCDKFIMTHLKKLDINTIQIQPIMKSKSTYWGYDVVDFMQHNKRYGTLSDLNAMIDILHNNGFKVVLDVVFNHTAMPIKGVSYYDWNVTGCENTVDVKNSLDVIIPAMKYWLNDIGVDGFRYDLATVLGREGADFNNQSEFFKIVKEQFSDKIHIAEPYDLGQMCLGQFPQNWYEINHHSRDTIRKGYNYNGTPVISEERSIGFVTVHDGFTLRDLTEYNCKHNLENGEDNRDGSNDNNSWNHGIEGYSDDPVIIKERNEHRFGMLNNLRTNCKNWLMLEGDCFGNSKNGNNNTYLLSNETSWVNWDLYESEMKKLHDYSIIKES